MIFWLNVSLGNRHIQFALDAPDIEDVEHFMEELQRDGFVTGDKIDSRRDDETGKFVELGRHPVSVAKANIAMVQERR